MHFLGIGCWFRLMDYHVRTVDLNTVHNSSLPETLASDDFHNVPYLSTALIKELCSTNVYIKAKCF